MQKRQYLKTDRYCSLLGLGCMRFPKIDPEKTDIDIQKANEIIDYAYNNGVNYFDTAYMYHDGQSELVIGEALKKYPRESFFLADKMPMWMVKQQGDVEKIFYDQLKKCQVEYFDFYLAHAQGKVNFAMFEQYNAYEFLHKMKEEGKIKHLGFSFHDSPEMLKTILAAHEWDFAQIQMNYLDWTMQDAKSQYEIITEYGVPVIVMEPVRGGLLADLCPQSNELFKSVEPTKSIASWALRYVASKPNVMTILSGMSNMEQIVDNIETLGNFTPLSTSEEKTVEKAVELYLKNTTVPCTGCRYCMPCPMGVDIPKNFKIYNEYAISKNANQYKNKYNGMDEKEHPTNCVKCGKCVKVCPQSINIPEVLAKIQSKVDGILD